MPMVPPPDTCVSRSNCKWSSKSEGDGRRCSHWRRDRSILAGSIPDQRRRSICPRSRTAKGRHGRYRTGQHCEALRAAVSATRRELKAAESTGTLLPASGAFHNETPFSDGRRLRRRLHSWPTPSWHRSEDAWAVRGTLPACIWTPVLLRFFKEMIHRIGLLLCRAKT
jgi:hypothetical protein